MTRRWPLVGVVTFVLLVLGVEVLALVWLPGRQAGDASRTVERLSIENELRRTYATILGATLVLITGAAAWYNARIAQENLRLAHENLAIGQGNLEATREGQITERFTKAVEQLAATDVNGVPRLEIRLGGIYAMERIAQDSERDHETVFAVLGAYVRKNSPWPPSPGEDWNWRHDGSESDQRLLPNPRPDIQAILTVIGRRRHWHGDNGEVPDTTIDLSRCDLRGYSLVRAHLEHADLQFSHFDFAVLYQAKLDRAFLDHACFAGATVAQASFRAAWVSNANFANTLSVETADFTDAAISGNTNLPRHVLDLLGEPDPES